MLSVEQGNYVKPNRLTVAQLLQGWLQDYVRTNTAPRTTERYQEVVNVHLIPAFGSLPVLALRPEYIQRYYAKALDSGRRDSKGGLSMLTVHKHHRVLYEALKYGVKHGILVRNVAEAVDPSRGRSKKLAVVGPNDVQLILDASKETPYQTLFFTIAYIGLQEAAARRFEEGLQADDISTENVAKMSPNLPQEEVLR